ncbi:MAG: flagellar biosynthesis protein FlhF [Lachnospiraceae bacterium]|nr:flagellar biosynthesis protein FlhF [Lachnospiraceae bacterium]
MIIKKFNGKNEDEALKAARGELGAGAVIMNVKKVKKKGLAGLFSRPYVEVTAAVEEEQDTYTAHTQPAQEPKAPAASGSTKPLGTLQPVKSLQPGQPLQPRSAAPRRTSDISQYKDVLTDEEYEKLHPDESQAGESPKRRSTDKVEDLQSLIEKQIKTVMSEESGEAQRSSEKKESKNKEVMSFIKLIYTTLINNEVDEKYANDLVEEIEKLSKPGVTIDYLLSNIYQKLILRFGVNAGLTASENGPKVIFVLGPTGVGKTTTIAKLASDMAVNQKKKVALLTTDTYRIKAAEQLRTYADIIPDMPFRVVYTADDLKEALGELKEYDFIFVDTAGYSPKDVEKRDEMKHILEAAKEITEIETYLVLSVTTKYRDLLSICDSYKEMGEYKIVFTKLDETSCFGNIYNIRVYTGAEIGYMTDGQEVPDDIETFNPQFIVRSILGGS